MTSNRAQNQQPIITLLRRSLLARQARTPSRTLRTAYFTHSGFSNSVQAVIMSFLSIRVARGLLSTASGRTSNSQLAEFLNGNINTSTTDMHAHSIFTNVPALSFRNSKICMYASVFYTRDSKFTTGILSNSPCTQQVDRLSCTVCALTSGFTWWLKPFTAYGTHLFTKENILRQISSFLKTIST